MSTQPWLRTPSNVARLQQIIDRYLRQEISAPLAVIKHVDISPKMVDAARLRLGSTSNAEVVLTNGSDLSQFGDDRFDLVLAIDVFPYLVQIGATLVVDHFRESARVLRRGGEMVLFNYAHGRRRSANTREIHEIANATGFVVERSDQQALRMWDGVGYHLRKP